MSRRVRFRFRLYVADGALNSALALSNLTAICQAHLPGRHDIEIVDVFQNPERAVADGIFLTPTLVRLAPLPVRRIVGALTQTQVVLSTLGLEPQAV